MTYTSKNIIQRTSDKLDLDLYGLTFIQMESLPCASQRIITYPRKNEITNTHQNRIENQYIHSKLLTPLQCEFQNHTQNTAVNNFQLKSSIPELDLVGLIFIHQETLPVPTWKTTHQSKTIHTCRIQVELEVTLSTNITCK